MTKLKTWMLLVALLVLLILVGILVGVITWHMAYEEASFRAAVGLQDAIESGKRECREYIRAILKHQGEYAKDVKPSIQNKIPLNIGILGLESYDTLVVKEAINDMRNNISKYQYEAMSLQHSNKTLLEQTQELHQTFNVNVFVGLDSENELIQTVAWARGRPDAKDFVVFISSAFITDQTYVERKTNDWHAVIRMKKSYPSVLQAVLYQIQKQNLDNIILLVDSEDSTTSRQVQMVKNSSNIVQFSEVVSKNSTSPIDLVQLLEMEMESLFMKNPNNTLGLFITQKYMFTLLAEAAIYSRVFSLPWFTTVNSVLFELQRTFLRKDYFDLSYPLLDGNAVKNFKLLGDVTSRIRQSDLASRSKNSNKIELTYDSVIIAHHIALWLAEIKDVDVENFSKWVALESSLWVGIAGVLKISNSLEFEHGNYFDLHYTRNLSAQFVEYPSGIWQVRGYIPYERL